MIHDFREQSTTSHSLFCYRAAFAGDVAAQKAKLSFGPRAKHGTGWLVIAGTLQAHRSDHQVTCKVWEANAGVQAQDQRIHTSQALVSQDYWPWGRQRTGQNKLLISFELL